MTDQSAVPPAIEEMMSVVGNVADRSRVWKNATAGLAQSLPRSAAQSLGSDLSDSDRGATEFGRSALTKAEQLMIVIDLRFVLRDA
ncbi:hypothetical protein [Bradyrhizobium sp. WSM2254]|uniref:hypothetical protein n=1 Tax=Bradyrhizobium sp. WSM2254 TaxID=1188263 RepID=UPI0012EBBB3A|nr:hypothetical protein [Bradyrhizobium sp. WSM2254]